MNPEPHRKYLPGQAVTFLAHIQAVVPPEVSGGRPGYIDQDAPVDLALTLTFRDGSTVVDAAPAHDGVGYYHSTIMVPEDAPPGPCIVEWRASGPFALANANHQYVIDILRLLA